MIASKKAREEEGAFMTGLKGKKAMRAQGDKSKAVDGGKPKPIKHTAQTLQTFKSLKLTAPVTTADLPNLVVELDKKKKTVQDKMASWEAERKKKMEAASAESAKE